MKGLLCVLTTSQLFIQQGHHTLIDAHFIDREAVSELYQILLHVCLETLFLLLMLPLIFQHHVLYPE